MKTLFWVLFLCFFLSFWVEAQEKLITQAIEALEELQGSLDQPLFAFLLKRAEGIAIFPEVKRVGLVVGGYFGNGLLLREDERGRFFGPAFFRIEGVSIGPQIGIQSQGLVLLVMNQTGIEAFYQDGITLGGSLSVAAGPVGRGISAGIDSELS
ncbi:MAG: lipid-binding SYLF domain-containing protein [Candidatus Caldatribacteriaceae bacterium]